MTDEKHLYKSGSREDDDDGGGGGGGGGIPQTPSGTSLREKLGRSKLTTTTMVMNGTSTPVAQWRGGSRSALPRTPSLNLSTHSRGSDIATPLLVRSKYALQDGDDGEFATPQSTISNRTELSSAWGSTHSTPVISNVDEELMTKTPEGRSLYGSSRSTPGAYSKRQMLGDGAHVPEDGENSSLSSEEDDDFDQDHGGDRSSSSSKNRKSSSSRKLKKSSSSRSRSHKKDKKKKSSSSSYRKGGSSSRRDRRRNPNESIKEEDEESLFDEDIEDIEYEEDQLYRSQTSGEVSSVADSLMNRSSTSSLTSSRSHRRHYDGRQTTGNATTQSPRVKKHDDNNTSADEMTREELLEQLQKVKEQKRLIDNERRELLSKLGQVEDEDDGNDTTEEYGDLERRHRRSSPSSRDDAESNGKTLHRRNTGKYGNTGRSKSTPRAMRMMSDDYHENNDDYDDDDNDQEFSSPEFERSGRGSTRSKRSSRSSSDRRSGRSGGRRSNSSSRRSRKSRHRSPSSTKEGGGIGSISSSPLGGGEPLDESSLRSLTSIRSTLTELHRRQRYSDADLSASASMSNHGGSGSAKKISPGSSDQQRTRRRRSKSLSSPNNVRHASPPAA